MEGANVMTNQQFWGVVRLVRSIVEKSKTTEEAVKEIDKIIEQTQYISPEEK